MATRIPLRIYRVKKDQKTGQIQPLVRPSSRFVQGRTADDIEVRPDGTQVIRLINGDIPGISFPDGQRYFAVQGLPGQELPFITVTGDITGGVSIPGPTQSGAGIKIYYIQPGLSSLVGDNVPDVFEFYVNPQNLTPQYEKLQTEIRTRGGYEIQHWGERLVEIRVTGKSGGLHRDTTRSIDPGGSQGQSLGPAEDITNSTAWKRLSQLRRLYNSDHAIKNAEDLILLGMNYYDRFYIGYFISFSGPTADADRPYVVDYAFSFKVQQEIFNVFR